MDQVLSRIPRVTNENVLVGFDTADDAGVYKLTAECALVQTIDFFTPIVDDPYHLRRYRRRERAERCLRHGRDVRSRRCRCWRIPAQGDLDDLLQILSGGAEKMREADCMVLGGHSITDDEIKFGYAVTGTIHPERIKTNAGARARAMRWCSPSGSGRA